MKYSHIFLDFDETLFCHEKYVLWADKTLSGLLDKPPGFFKDGFWEFHEQLADPHLRIFHHEAHAQAVTGKGWDYISGELEKAQKPRKTDFCYPEVHGFLQWLHEQPVDVRILTFGKGDYQRYKINTCPIIKKLHIPVHVVTEPKRAFLAREFADISRGVLIDDKHPLQLPEKWDEIWINRKEIIDGPRAVSKTIKQIHTLMQAKAII